MRRLVHLLLLALALAFGAALPAQAKVVGVVFDDSGSMGGKARTPAFVFQILAASLDRDDVLFGARFGRYLERAATTDAQGNDVLFEPSYEEFAQDVVEPLLIDRQSLDDTLGGIGKWSNIVPDTGTPFQPIDMMMRHILDRATERGDKEAVLIVLTDGEFMYSPDSAVLGRKYEQLRRDYPDVTLSSYFIGFEGGRTDLRGLVRDQGVAEALDTAVNAGTMKARFGSIHQHGALWVRTSDELRNLLLRIVAALSNTELDEDSSLIGKSGDSVSFTPPFTITNVVSVSLAPVSGRLTRLDGAALQSAYPGGTLEPYEVAMDAPDAGGTSEAWAAQIVKFRPANAFAADTTHVLPFSGPVTDAVEVLFKSSLFFDFTIRDEEDRVQTPGPDGVILLNAFEDYTVAVELFDTANGGSVKIEMDDLPAGETSFTMTRALDATGQTVDLEMDTARDIAFSPRPFSYRAEDDDEISVVFRMTGFVTAQARPLRIRVVDVEGDFALTATPATACPACTARNVDLRLSQNAEWVDAMGLEALFSGPADPDPYRFVLRPGADIDMTGVRVVDATGAVVLEEGMAESAPVPFTVGTAEGFTVQIDGRQRPGSDTFDLAFDAVGLEPVNQTAGVRFTVGISRKPVTLTLVETRNGGAGSGVEALLLRPDGFDADPLYVLEVDNVTPDWTPDALTGTTKGIGWDFDYADPAGAQAVQDGAASVRILARPQEPSFACCLLEGPRETTFGLRTGAARAATTLTIQPLGILSRIWICIWYLLILYLAVVALCWIVTPRFPATSRLLVTEKTDRSMVQRYKLRGGIAKYLQHFLWMRRSERAAPAGLQVQATDGGPAIRPRAGGYPDLTLVSSGRELDASQFGEKGQTPLELSWGAMLTESGRDGREFRFVENWRTER